jgi:hypothetical protein
MTKLPLYDETVSRMKDISIATTLPVVFITIIAVLLTTRFLTRVQSEALAQGRRPLRIPYWIPFLGNLPGYLLSPISCLEHGKYVMPL